MASPHTGVLLPWPLLTLELPANVRWTSAAVGSGLGIALDWTQCPASPHSVLFAESPEHRGVLRITGMCEAQRDADWASHTEQWVQQKTHQVGKEGPGYAGSKRDFR